MRILFLTSAHNSLSQRAWIELTERGHHVQVALALSDEAMLHAVDEAQPELIIAPMLTRAIPEAIWRRVLCIIVHPGPPGDRGPSSLDWAILDNAPRWGVTLLQADAELDGGPIWASREFATRPVSKSSLYRNDVIPAAVSGLLEIVANLERGFYRRERLDYARPEVWGRPRPRIKQSDRRLDWSASTDTVLRVLRSADGTPGVLDRIGDLDLVVFGGVADERLRGEPGALLATRDGAICRATGDGAVWLPALRRRHTAERRYPKLPATAVLGAARLAGVPRLPLVLTARADGATYRQIWYAEHGAVGLLHWDLPQGAMSTAQCRRLRQAVAYAATRPTRVLVLLGGAEYFSNGIHLGTIEAADDPAIESWHNINAIDDLVGALLRMDHKLVVAALEGNAGAGGAILAAGGGPGVGDTGGGAQSALRGDGRAVRVGVLDLCAAAAGGSGVRRGADGALRTGRRGAGTTHRPGGRGAGGAGGGV